MRSKLLAASLSILLSTVVVSTAARAEHWVVSASVTWGEQELLDTDSITTNPDGSVRYHTRLAHSDRSGGDDYSVRCDQNFSGKEVIVTSLDPEIGGDSSVPIDSLSGQTARFVCHK